MSQRRFYNRAELAATNGLALWTALPQKTGARLEKKNQTDLVSELTLADSRRNVSSCARRAQPGVFQNAIKHATAPQRHI